jgi:hypothetical protein
MLGTSILTRQDFRRDAAEALITDLFNTRYGAQISIFPETLIAKFNSEGQPVCAAGLRFVNDDFFSEQYLNEPIEQVISSACGLEVKRDELFEVTSLASRDARHTIAFVRAVILYGQVYDYGWSFFTLTARMSLMLSHLGINLTYLARAERSRVPRSADWGTYYDHDPCVFAFRNPAHSMNTHLTGEPCHAFPL